MLSDTEITRNWRAKNPERYAAQKRTTAERQEVRRKANPIKRKVEIAANTSAALKRKERIAGRPRPSVCEVCGTVGKRITNKRSHPIAFDHDHKTGAFRGWICNSCNMILGMADDCPDLLRKLADYLEGTV